MTARAPNRPTAQPATQPLLDLAAATRPDIARRDLEGAILAAHEAGWTWPRTMVEVARLLAQGEDHYALLDAARDPLKLRTRRTQ